MMRVKVALRDAAGNLVEKGQLEFHGLRIRQPDGSYQVEKDHRGKPVPEEVILRPPGVVPPRVAVRIGQALTKGRTQGEIEGFTWSVVT